MTSIADRIHLHLQFHSSIHVKWTDLTFIVNFSWSLTLLDFCFFCAKNEYIRRKIESLIETFQKQICHRFSAAKILNINIFVSHVNVMTWLSSLSHMFHFIFLSSFLQSSSFTSKSRWWWPSTLSTVCVCLQLVAKICVKINVINSISLLSESKNTNLTSSWKL